MEPIQDSYLTLAEPAEHQIKIQRSRFIALGFPIKNEDDVLIRLEEIRRREHAATHYCYAYSYGVEEEKCKSSDGGEPSGTAGRPILQILTGRKLRYVLAVVVRYFGGIKLGPGGLARAYSQAATEMLDRAVIIEKLVCDRIRVVTPLSLYDQVQRIIQRERHFVVGQEFAENVVLKIDVRQSRVSRFTAALTELSGGKIRLEKIG